MADSSHTRLVMAAQSGDGQACQELVAAHLPLLYNIVRRALGGHADVDDVVQETMLRVVRDLPALRDPNSFRSWMVAIAIRQIVSYRDRQRAAGGHVMVVEEADELPDPGFEDLTLLRLQVSGQRREVAEASRWLDDEYRLLFSLWWQENAGWLSRADLAGAIGMSVAHAGVRLQRMREQVEVCREIVVALDLQPRCGRLAAAVSSWDGEPSPLWRKRIARHLRGCEACLAPSAGQVPLERLLLTFAPFAVPTGFAAALAAKTLALLPGAAVSGASAVAAGGGGSASGFGLASGGGGAGIGVAATDGAGPSSLVGKLTQAIIAHPLASMATCVAVILGAAISMVTLPQSPVEKPAVIAAPQTPNVPQQNPAVVPSATTPSPAPRQATTAPAAPPPPAGSPAPAEPGVPLGAWSLESAFAPGQFVTYVGDYATLQQVSATSSDQARQQATLTVVKGLADPGCVTFRANDGRYLRHMMMRLRLSNDEGTQLFREDATFCPRAGAVAGTFSLESYNYRPQVLRYRTGAFYVNLPDGTKEFGPQSSFLTRDPWTA